MHRLRYDLENEEDINRKLTSNWLLEIDPYQRRGDGSGPFCAPISTCSDLSDFVRAEEFSLALSLPAECICMYGVRNAPHGSVCGSIGIRENALIGRRKWGCGTTHISTLRKLVPELGSN